MSDALLDRFFEQARAVHLGSRDRIELSSSELAELVSNEVLRLRFATRLRLEAQDPELKSLILLYLRGVGSKEEELAEEFRIDADGIHQYVGQVGLGAFGAGIATILATGGPGAFVLVAGGLLAVAMAGLNTQKMRKQGLQRAMFAKRIRELLEELRDV